MNNMQKTLDYYNRKSNDFTTDTQNVEFSSLQEQFCSYLPKGGSILDLGCGAGRDSKSFMELGFDVTAMDGSEELCKIASLYIGVDVVHATFQEYTPGKAFDGIWACASLLHLEYDEISPVMKKYANTLRQGGCFYVSFKYGEFVGDRNGRYFTDMNEMLFDDIMNDLPELKVDQVFITSDARPGRENEKWFNAFLIKR